MTRMSSLANHEVHVWLAHLDRASVCEECCHRLLSLEEQDRASRFKFDRERRRYIASHAALRSAVASYVPIAPEDLRFSTGLDGKPALTATSGTPVVQFNLSHSSDIALIAVTREKEIGIDVEWVKQDFPFLEVAQRFFSAREVAALTSLPSELQRLAFFKCWTSKEAFLKAKGIGLGGKLVEVEIGLTQEGDVRVKGTMPNWSLIELKATDGYVSAVAVESGGVALAADHREAIVRPSAHDESHGLLRARRCV